MAEPSATAAGIAAAGLTFFGVATGLDPATLIAGFAGGVWAQSYLPPVNLWKRLALVFLASVLAGYLAPTAAAVIAVIAVKMFAGLQGVLTLAALQLPTAVLIGLTSHRVLGPAVMRFTAKKMEDFSK